MPSSKKTPNLHLNKWLGSDKPKKDDFVEDNEILDQAIGDLRGRLGQTGESAEALVQQAKAELEKKLADTKIDLESSVGTVRTGLSSHTDNGAVHVTQAQKESWNAHTTLSAVHVTQGRLECPGSHIRQLPGQWVGPAKDRAGLSPQGRGGVRGRLAAGAVDVGLADRGRVRRLLHLRGGGGRCERGARRLLRHEHGLRLGRLLLQAQRLRQHLRLHGVAVTKKPSRRVPAGALASIAVVQGRVCSAGFLEQVL